MKTAVQSVFFSREHWKIDGMFSQILTLNRLNLEVDRYKENIMLQKLTYPTSPFPDLSIPCFRTSHISV